MGKKRKKIWASDAERRAWDAKVDADIEYARGLVRKAWAQMGIPEPKDTLTYLEELRVRAESS